MVACVWPNMFHMLLFSLLCALGAATHARRHGLRAAHLYFHKGDCRSSRMRPRSPDWAEEPLAKFFRCAVPKAPRATRQCFFWWRRKNRRRKNTCRCLVEQERNGVAMRRNSLIHSRASSAWDSRVLSGLRVLEPEGGPQSIGARRAVPPEGLGACGGAGSGGPPARRSNTRVKFPTEVPNDLRSAPDFVPATRDTLIDRERTEQTPKCTQPGGSRRPKRARKFRLQWCSVANLWPQRSQMKACAAWIWPSRSLSFFRQYGHNSTASQPKRGERRPPPSMAPCSTFRVAKVANANIRPSSLGASGGSTEAPGTRAAKHLGVWGRNSL